MTFTIALAVPSESIAPLTLLVMIIVSPRSPALKAAAPAAIEEALWLGIEAAIEVGKVVPEAVPVIVGEDILGIGTVGTETLGVFMVAVDKVGTLIDGAVILPTLGKNGMEL